MLTIPELIRWRARVTPHVPAVWSEGRETTYRELDTRANQVANALIAAGVRPGDRICAMDQNHGLYFELIFGIAKAGAVFVPVNFRLAPPEVRAVIADAEAELVFAGGPFCAMVEQVRRDLPAVRKFIAFDRSDGVWQNYSALRDVLPTTDPCVPIDPSATTWQTYTSGTTGSPKGVEITTSNLLPYLLAMPSWLGGLREGQVAFTVAPFHFSAGIFYTLLTVIAGTTLVLVKEFEPAETLKLIGERKINHAFLPPAVLLRILQVSSTARADLTSLKSIVYGGSAILTDVLRRAIAYFGCEFTQMYGLTETTAALTCLSWADHDLDGPNSHRLKSCGQPLYGTDIRAVDRNGRECPTGEMGEIVVRTPMMMKGYWKKPEATAEVIRDGWLYTGDGGIIDADGFIYIQDRIKDMIVSGGANIYSAEVENCLIGHPAVADVAVIGVPDETWGEAVKAMVVLKPGAKAEADELIEFCKGRIANYKRPRSVEFIASIPRNANGKVLKRELRRPYWEGRERKVV